MNISAFVIAALVGVVVLLAAMRSLGAEGMGRRAGIVISVLAFVLIYITLNDNPALLRKYTLQIVAALVAILLAFLAFLRKQF